MPGEASLGCSPGLCPWTFLDTRAPDGSGSHLCLSLTPFFLLFTEVVSYFYILLQFPSSHSSRESRN